MRFERQTSFITVGSPEFVPIPAIPLTNLWFSHTRGNPAVFLRNISVPASVQTMCRSRWCVCCILRSGLLRDSFHLIAVERCLLQEDGWSSCTGVKFNGRKPLSDEEIFLQRLYDFLDEQQPPVGRIQSQGFQKGNSLAKWCSNYGQGRSQEFTKGDKPGGLGDGNPHRGPGAEYGNSRDHQRGRDKNWCMVTGGGDMHPWH